MTCTEGVELLERQFVDGLSADEGATLRAHVAGCERCRKAQAQLARVDEALYGEVLSPQRVEQLEAELLGRAAPKPPVHRPSPAWVRPVAFAAAASLAVVVWWGVAGRPQTDEFQARGGPGAAVALKALCVGAAGATVGVAKPGDSLACGPGQAVQLVYSARERVRVTARTAGGDDLVAPGLVLEPAAEAAFPSSTPVGAWLTQPTELTVTFVSDATGRALSSLRLTLAPPAR